MRSLSSTLLAAQRAATRVPYVRVEAHDRLCGIARLAWTRLYAGGEPDGPHAATMPGDGSLVRARVDPSTNNLYLQRVASPGAGSGFSSWTLVTQVSPVSGIALASRGATVLLFYVDPNQATVWLKESADYGQSFGAAASMLTHPPAVDHLAAAVKTGGTVCLLYSNSNNAFVVKRSGGVWGAVMQWTSGLSSITGLAVTHLDDWNAMLAGKDGAGNAKVWTGIWGDGVSQAVDTGSQLAEVMTANAGSGVEYKSPTLAHPDVYRAFVVEAYGGSVSYQRPLWTHTPLGQGFVANLWREPTPFDLSAPYGVALTHSTSQAWLSTPSGVWSAPLSPTPLDMSADCLDLAVSLTPRRGSLRLLLRNDDGRYSDLSSGVLRQGAEVRVSPGYRTSSGNEVSAGLAFWVSALEHRSAGGRATLAIEAEDAWWLLRSWRARRQFTWTAGQANLFQLLSFVLARVGLDVASLSAGAVLGNRTPAFTVHPGESGAQVIERLLAMAPDALFFEGGSGYLKEPVSSESSCYSYGTAHTVLAGAYRSLAQQANRVQVFGADLLAEAFAWAQVEALGDRLRQVHDLNLSTASQAADRGSAELRREALAAQAGEVVSPVNCGQQMYDVVDITDARAGLSAAKRRVLGLELRYRPQGGGTVYEQRLTLGGV